MNNTIGLDYLQEAIILGIDVIIFGLCLKGYHSHKNTIKALKVNFFTIFIDNFKTNLWFIDCYDLYVIGCASIEHR